MAAGCIALSSCDDFLTTQSTSSPSDQTFLDSDEAVSATTYPLYNYAWWGFNEKFYYSVGDGRSNNINAPWSDYIYPYTKLTEQASSPGLHDAWKSFYSVVAQANNTINRIKDFSGPAVTADAKSQGIAEARFMRGIAYWYIGSIWNRAVLYENTSAMVGNYVVPPHRVTDVIEFAIRDLEYAAANLPKSQANEGRVTCYSAYGLLSRIYLSMAGLTTDGAYDGSNIATDFNRGTRNTYYLDLAKKAAVKCMEGPYSLMDNYGDLFDVKTWNNNRESVFQLQWIAGPNGSGADGCHNPISAFFGWSSMVDDAGWGNATYASYDIIRTYDPAETDRRHYTVTTYGEFYPEFNKKNGGYTVGVTEVDDNAYKKRCHVKKHVLGKFDDNGVSYKQSSGVNTYMMRLAEVYLNLAEAILGNAASTSDAVALEYFNQVRTRAGMPAKNKIDYDDIHYERRIELAFEGQYWYDLLRRAYYQQAEVVNYLNHQDRHAGYEYDESEPCKYAKTSDATDVSTATIASLQFPLSDVDLGRNPRLSETPVSYEFGEREVTPADLFN